jgi:hypothetical protein
MFWLMRRVKKRSSSAKLKRMKKAVELAESIAPTRPHPGIESAAGNLLAGPFVSMVDRTRDALSDRQSHKHSHR